MSLKKATGVKGRPAKSPGGRKFSRNIGPSPGEPPGDEFLPEKLPEFENEVPAFETRRKCQYEVLKIL